MLLCARPIAGQDKVDFARQHVSGGTDLRCSRGNAVAETLASIVVALVHEQFESLCCGGVDAEGSGIGCEDMPSAEKGVSRLERKWLRKRKGLLLPLRLLIADCW